MPRSSTPAEQLDGSPCCQRSATERTGRSSLSAPTQAPGGHASIVGKFGSTPQLRLIVQPVTVDGGQVKVHDFTAHLVYSYFTPKDAPKQGFIPAASPDETKSGRFSTTSMR